MTEIKRKTHPAIKLCLVACIGIISSPFIYESVNKESEEETKRASGQIAPDNSLDPKQMGWTDDETVSVSEYLGQQKSPNAIPQKRSNDHEKSSSNNTQQFEIGATYQTRIDWVLFCVNKQLALEGLKKSKFEHNQKSVMNLAMYDGARMVDAGKEFKILAIDGELVQGQTPGDVHIYWTPKKFLSGR